MSSTLVRRKFNGEILAHLRSKIKSIFLRKIASVRVLNLANFLAIFAVYVFEHVTRFILRIQT